jgi:outer membrane receptor protein involved in Fe transport
MHDIRKRMAGGLLAIAILHTLPSAIANDLASPKVRLDIPSQPLSDALLAAGEATKRQILFPGQEMDGLKAPALHGEFTTEEAARALLAGTQFIVEITSEAILIKGRSTAAADPLMHVPAADRIVVTGSRIRGAPASAPVRTMTSEEMHRAGQSDIGEALRSSPLNFGGGQNPGIGTGQSDANVNVNGSSSVNLLGLGPNATLTLLNGNRLSYTGINSAVDISAIPAEAVDRIEIIADGASAIYGADAVAGVVNVILRRNYEGLMTQARLGGSTDGGNFQQQYDVTAGTGWRDGGLLAVYDYSSNREILSSSRDYAAGMATDTTLYPRLKRHNVLLSAHQELGDVTANVDLVYKNGQQNAVSGNLAGQSHTASGSTLFAKTSAFTIAPSLTAHIGEGWTARLLSSYGIDKTRIYADYYYGGSAYGNGSRQYDNDQLSLELGADGGLFKLPAGDVRAAIGGGYRRTSIKLLGTTLGDVDDDFDRYAANSFGYAELLVPAISQAQMSPIGRSLTLTAAFRYEDNSGTSSVALPKFGIVYEPTAGVSVKASWGKSFRLPTLDQRYASYAAVLVPTQGYATGFPVSSTFILLQGSNSGLKPERSTNWTVSAELKPVFEPGLTGSISYFHFNYSDRIVTPLSSSRGALNNPTYADLVTLSPSASLQEDIIGGAPLGLQNVTSDLYDPAQVVAILDSRYRNVAREIYQGVNLSMRYSLGDKARQSVDFSFDGTWIDSKQKLSPETATVDLSGTLFNPPSLRGRLGVTYATPHIALSGFANISSSLIDQRTSQRYRIEGSSTFDLSAFFQAGAGFELGATINNLFNFKPPLIVIGSAYSTPFDTTNYSQIGRFMAVQLRKRW